MQSIARSRRQPGNEAVSMRVIYSESEEAAASSASMLGTPMIHTSLPPPSLPPSLLSPFFQTTSNAVTVASLKVQRLKRKGQVGVHPT